MVLDCSVTLSWFIPDEQNEFALDTLKKASRDGATVPFHWNAEMSNGLLMCLRRDRIDGHMLVSAFAALNAMPITTDRKSAENIDSKLIFFAQEVGLTIYDALYIECAQRLRLPLVTFDKALAKAAKSVGVEVFGPYK